MITKIKVVLFFGLFVSISIYAQSNHNDENYKKYKETYHKYLPDENIKFLNESVNYLSKYLIKNPNDAEGYYERSQVYMTLKIMTTQKLTGKKL